MLASGNLRSQSTLVTDLTKAYFKILDCTVSVEEIYKGRAVSEVSDTGVRKVCPRQFFFGGCSATKRTKEDVQSQLLRYQRLVLRFSLSSDTNLTEKHKKVLQAKRSC